MMLNGVGPYLLDDFQECSCVGAVNHRDVPAGYFLNYLLRNPQSDLPSARCKYQSHKIRSVSKTKLGGRFVSDATNLNGGRHVAAPPKSMSRASDSLPPTPRQTLFPQAR